MAEAAILPFPPRPEQTGDAAQSGLDEASSARARLRRRARTSALALGGMLVVITPLVSFVPISGAVIASGEISTESRAQSIVHPAGGVLSELLVRDGDRVDKGQILLRFATSVTEPGAKFSGENLTALLVRKARLEAEVQGLSAVPAPSDLTAEQLRQPEVAAALSRERQVLAIKRSELSSQLAMIDDQKRQAQAEIAGFRGQISAISRQRALLAPELRGLRNLYQQELVTINRLNEAERNDVTLSSEAATLQTRIRQAEARLVELDNRSRSIREGARTAAGNELNELVLALADSRIREAGASDAFERSVVRAPLGGIIDGLAFATVGSAVPAGQEILRIIPQTQAMVVQVKIAPGEIDQIRVGQSARVRFSGFNQQTTPEVPGKLVFVSADRTEDPRTGAPFYRANVAVDAAAFRRETGLQISSGMPAEAFITTAPRSLISYIMKPLGDQVTRAFRDDQ